MPCLSRFYTCLAPRIILAALVITVVPVPSLAQQDDEGVTPSLAVVRFTNVTGEATDAWVGLGTAESLAATLGNGITVESVAEAERLGRARVIEGTFERIGDRLRLTALLTDIPSRRVVQAALVDGQMEDLFSLQDALAGQLRAAISDAAGLSQAVLQPPSLPGTTSNAAVPRSPPVVPTRRASGTGGATIDSTATLDGPPPPAAPEVIARDDRGQATIRAIRLDGPLSIDGHLDEAVYDTVPAIGGFIQQVPDEGAPATERTDTWVFFTDDTIYIAARCWDSQPERMVANEMRRDNLGIFQNENFAVALDTFYDKRNAYMFHTNPLGGLFDGIITAGNMNRDWNGVWETSTQRFENGWTVEIAIPFKTIRFSPGSVQTWGIHLRRIVRWKNETSYLTAVPAAYGMRGIMELAVAGAMVGVEAPASTGNIEIKPYVIADLTTDRLATPPTANALDGNAGFDLKYAVTEGLTADFTYNTDFAQVEVDEQQVNLTRFSLFFPEKREFFLEGQGIFDFGGGRVFGGGGSGLRVGGSGGGGNNTPILFFSRRIGIAGGLPVPIDAGGRLTGKVGPYSVGLLDIRTADDARSGSSATNFAVVRLRRDILRRSSIGALATHRSVSVVGDGANRTYGVDGTFAFYDNLRINSYLARTETPGLGEEALSYRGQFDYNADRYGLQLERLVVGEDFNPEVGFLRRTNFQRSFASARFSPRPAGIAAIRKLSWEANLDYITSGAGRLETRIASGTFSVELENSDQFLVEASDNFEFLPAPFEVASGVVIPVDGYNFVDTRATYIFGNQRRLSGGVSVSHGGFFGGDKTTVEISRGRVDLASRFSIEPAVSVNRVEGSWGRFTTTLVNARSSFTITPRAFIGALVQYNSAAESLSTNIRLRWEYQPGSELFVVYTDLRDTLVPSFPQLENRAFVVKFNRLFRF